MLKIKILPILQYALDGLFHEGRVVRMTPLENKCHTRFRRWVVLEDSKCFLRPEDLSGRNPPAEAASVADALRFSQKCLAGPELLFRPLALGNFLFQLLVGNQKLAGSLRDPLIEFLCDPLLFAQQPCFLQSDRRLIRRYTQKKSLGLPRKIGSLRPCYYDADLIPKPQSQWHDRNVSLSNRVPYQQRPFLWVVFQTGLEKLTDLLRRRLQISGLSEPEHLDGRLANPIFQPRIGKVQTQHAYQHVEQRTDNLRWLLAGPHGGKGLDTDQIIDTALQAPDLGHCLFHLTVLA